MTTRSARCDAAAAVAAYTLLSLLVTWPLARDPGHNVAGDYGDPLFNTWVLAWNATHLFRGGWWSPNIFAPHPLALAYSDHLAAQGLQALPLFWVTSNPILVYNIILLSTFALSGLGMFLFVRQLTGSAGAAFVAGLAYAFAPYRIGALPHLQVLSSAWMPFAFFGLRRHFDSGRTAPLVWSALAWIAQNLSSGYYLLFFSPIVVLYAIWEITTRSLWGDRGTLIRLLGAVAAVALCTAPFLMPYLELRGRGFGPRSLAETREFSANVFGYLTADVHLWAWGSVFRYWPRPEGSLFPGVTIVLLALAAALRGVRLLVLLPLLVVAPLLFGQSIRLPGIKITDLPRALAVLTLVALAAVAWSRGARDGLRRWMLSPAGCFAIVVLFSLVMSFGPTIRARGRVVMDVSLYAFFYRYVPGFDGLRVPARFAMIVAFGLAALAGIAVAMFRRTWVAVGAATLIVVEVLGMPVPTNLRATRFARADLAPLPPLERPIPQIYHAVAALPQSATLLELPLGEPAVDLRYMYFSIGHWRRLVNGYSGGFPTEYERLDQALQDVLIRPDRAWDVLRAASNPTHALVHQSYYAGERGPRVSEWLRGRGARELAAVGADHLYQLR